MDEQEKPENRRLRTRAPWYLYLIWAVLGILASVFILASLGYGGAEYGYIEVSPGPGGGCRVIIAIIDAIPEGSPTRGCLLSKFAACNVMFGSDCDFSMMLEIPAQMRE